jgi:hypothetical protein
MSKPLGRAAAVVLLAGGTAAVALSQTADGIICQQLRLLSGFDLLRKSVEEYKTTEQMIGSLAEGIGAEIEACKATPRKAECASDVLDAKAGNAERLRGEARKLRTRLQEIEQRLHDVDGKRRELEAKLHDKGSCRDGQ